MPFPESAGGVGGSLIDAGLLAEELGRAALPSPYIHTVAAGLTLLEAGRTDLVARIISGDLIVVPAFTEADPRPIPASGQARDCSRGRRRLPADRAQALRRIRSRGPSAAVFRPYRRGRFGEHGVTLMLVPGDAAGLERRSLATTGGDPAAELSFEDVAADGGDSGRRARSRLAGRQPDVEPPARPARGGDGRWNASSAGNDRRVHQDARPVWTHPGLISGGPASLRRHGHDGRRR